MYQHRDRGKYYVRKDGVIKAFFKHVRLDSNQKLLDVGCGEGVFLYYLQKSRIATYGVDIDPRAIAMASAVCRRTRFKNCSFREVLDDKDWRDFTIITSFNFLEHVTDPVGSMRDIFKLLAPKGVHVVAVPNYDRIPRLFDPVTDSPPNHFTLWTAKSLDLMLRKAGFENIRMHVMPLTAEDIGIHCSWRLRRFIGKCISTQNKSVDSVADRHRRYPAFPLFLTRQVRTALSLVGLNRIGRGCTLFAVAVKP